MISVRVAEVVEADVEALLRPVAADGSAVTPAGRRLELKAGPALLDPFSRLGDLPVGSAVVTPAGDLRAEYVVHVVVRSPEEPAGPASVRRGLLNGLRRLSELAIERVAVLPLGTGAGHLDMEGAADAMATVLVEHASRQPYPTEFLIAVESAYEREVFERALSRAGRPAETAGA